MVLGAKINFKADLFTDDQKRPSGSFQYIWRDNAVPSHHSEVNI